VAPILPVTADEIWRHLPGRREESVHLARFPERAELDELTADTPLVERWTRLMDLRDRVNAALEQARQQKTIGNSLAARVELTPSDEEAALLERYRADLPMLFIASQVELRSTAGRSGGAGEARPTAVAIARADGTKCPRCWRIVPRLVAAGHAGDADGLCDRCAEALAETVV
jgi:isoleucyl-tRNA synthetase